MRRTSELCGAYVFSPSVHCLAKMTEVTHAEERAVADDVVEPEPTFHVQVKPAYTAARNPQ